MIDDLGGIFSFDIFRQIQGNLPEEKVNRLKSVVMLLRTAADIHEEIRSKFAAFGVSQSKYYILLLLHEKKDGLATPSQIADFAGISRATVSGLIEGLEHDGLVERQLHKEDRRMVRVSITDKGREVLLKILPYDCKMTLDLVSCLDDEEVLQLMRIVDKLDYSVRSLRGTNKKDSKMGE